MSSLLTLKRSHTVFWCFIIWEGAKHKNSKSVQTDAHITYILAMGLVGHFKSKNLHFIIFQLIFLLMLTWTWYYLKMKTLWKNLNSPLSYLSKFSLWNWHFHLLWKRWAEISETSKNVFEKSNKLTPFSW